MNAHEIAIALTGRRAAEEALRNALLMLIKIEKRVLIAYHTDVDLIVAESDNFFPSWEGVRRFGDTRLFIEGIEPIEIAYALLAFTTASGGFKITVADDQENLCEMFLSNEVVDMAARGDDSGLFDVVRNDVDALKKAYAARLEKVRARENPHD